MTWKSHRAVTFVTVLAVTENPIAALCGMFGSTVPDQVEGPMWRHWHRKYSHWFVFYLPWVILFSPLTGKNGILQYGLFWFFVGALLHIVEDAVCGKVPFLTPFKKVTVLPRLFYTGSAKEHIFVFCYCVIMFGITIVRCFGL